MNASCLLKYYFLESNGTFLASALYHKHTMIVNNDSSIVNKFVSSLTNNARVLI
jgi:hypothetical protein